ncbi:MAG: hypothetical protein JWM78_1666 [Verrucomicrobiaceae bacterium]|nr:hypothetical protein [Verrucomicrobiaceae bacterium]
MSSDTTIIGLAELEKALDEFPEKLQRNVLRGAIRAACKVIADEAKARVPVLTGTLRDTIRVSVRIVEGVVVGSVKAGSRVKGGSGKSGAGRGAFYAQMVEFGTAAHFIHAAKGKALAIGAGFFAKTVAHPGAAQHPFFRPAISTKLTAAGQRFADYISARLDKLNQADNES